MTADDRTTPRAMAAWAAGPRFWTLLAAGSLGLGMIAGGIANAVHARAGNEAPDARAIREALALRLPKTKVGPIDCGSIDGLCEVIAGTTLFYVDRTARYLMIGRVYDLETRSDLTAARLLALNPDLLVNGAARRQPASATADAVTPPPKRVDPGELPPGGVIRWGPPDGPRLIVLSDFACSYCKRLTAELKAIGARVEERPISIFGAASRAAAERVLCAADPVAALHAAYGHDTLPPRRRCDVSGLDANEAFARRHGFSGTPVIIRADGAVLEGWRPAAKLRAFAEGRDR